MHRALHVQCFEHAGGIPACSVGAKPCHCPRQAHAYAHVAAVAHIREAISNRLAFNWLEPMVSANSGQGAATFSVDAARFAVCVIVGGHCVVPLTRCMERLDHWLAAWARCAHQHSSQTVPRQFPDSTQTVPNWKKPQFPNIRPQKRRPFPKPSVYHSESLGTVVISNWELFGYCLGTVWVLLGNCIHSRGV